MGGAGVGGQVGAWGVRCARVWGVAANAVYLCTWAWRSVVCSLSTLSAPGRRGPVIVDTVGML